MAACSSGSTASSSRAMAAPTPKASPPRSTRLRHGPQRSAGQDRPDARCAIRSALAAGAAPATGGRLVTAMRSVVLGCGSYLPAADPDQCRTGAARSTPPTNGSSQRTGIRQRHIAAEGETHLRSGDRTPRARALADAGRRRPDDRPDRRWRPRRPTTPFRPPPSRCRPSSASPTAPPSTCRRCARASSSRWRPPTISCAAAPTSARW